MSIYFQSMRPQDVKLLRNFLLKSICNYSSIRLSLHGLKGFSTDQAMQGEDWRSEKYKVGELIIKQLLQMFFS